MSSPAWPPAASRAEPFADTPIMAAISLRGVSKSFGGKKVADQITFDVADREFLVLLRPSGCGKSPLLRMLAGLEQVGSGEIHVGARRVDTLPPSARDMAFVFQSYALYPHMTVRRNITFPLIMRAHRWWFHLPLSGGRAKRRIEQTPAVRALVERTARTLALTEMLDQYPRTLSGGQRQRGALGRALGRQPPGWGAGAGGGAPAGGVHEGRAAVQPRRQAAQFDARRDHQTAPRSGQHLRLCDARPDRSHDHGHA